MAKVRSAAQDAIAAEVAEAHSDASEVFRKLTFTLADSPGTGTQFKTVTTALEDAKRVSGSDKDGQALTLICIHYLACCRASMSPTPKLALLCELDRVLRPLQFFFLDPDSLITAEGRRNAAEELRAMATRIESDVTR
jgi:hypothetical protein